LQVSWRLIVTRSVTIIHAFYQIGSHYRFLLEMPIGRGISSEKIKLDHGCDLTRARSGHR
jgi:hypothetical protein